MINKRALAVVMCMFFIFVNVLLPATSVRAASDTTPPVVNSISLDKNSGTNGDNIVVSVDASDNMGGIKVINIYYMAPSRDSLKNLQLLKGNDGKYRGTISIDANDAVGTWKVSFMTLMDDSSNSIKVVNSEIHSDPGYLVMWQDLSAGDFEIYGTSTNSTTPVIKGISVAKKVVARGESLTVVADLSEYISGIQYLDVYFNVPNLTISKSAELRKDIDGKYRGEVYVNSKDTLGLWKINNIGLKDSAGIEFNILNSEVYQSPQDALVQDFRSGDYEVVEKITDTTPPVLKNISVDKKTGTNGENIVVTVNASDDLSGVQSIYIYYEDPVSNEVEYMELEKSSDNEYKTTIPIDDNVSVGKWKVCLIQLVDNAMNFSYVTNSEVYSSPIIGGDLKDLSAGDFEVKKSIPVTGITVDKTNIDLTVGQKSLITAAVSPQEATNKSVTWTTSDAKVATVDNDGNITAIGAGIAIITATTVDGAKTSNSKVTVTNTVNGAPSVAYQGHVQNIGWQDYVRDGALSGTEGKSLRVEGFKIKLENAPAGLKIKYKAHVQNIGWQNWVYDGVIAGTQGQSLRVEALQISLEGTDADKYSVEYQAHVENEGWQNWVQDGQVAGSLGKSQRIEALRIKIVKNTPSVMYQGHVQNIGWQDYVKDGELSGTEGKSLRVEGFKIKLENAPVGLRVKYKAHVQNIGWQDWVYDGEIAGTQGKSLRVEALQIALEGTDADKYTIKYQAHVENVGWQDWVQDGQVTGSFGKSQRIEALRVVVSKK